jgi:dTDP-4-dehydrorhamnose reductase
MTGDKKTLVIGCQGLVGKYLWQSFPHAIGTHRTASEGIQKLDLAHPDLSELNINWKEYEYGAIASAIAKIGVCEQEPKISFAVNVTGTLQVAEQLLQKGLTPIFFSSDYVFDGKQGGYDELSLHNPLNEYGRQKALLEQEIPRLCKTNYLLFRLGKVFSLQKGDKSLLDEMAQRIVSKKPIRSAIDQIFNPVLIDDVVRSIHILQERKSRGSYVLCGSESFSRYDLSMRMIKLLNKEPSLIEKISLDDLCESFKRPKNTSMNNAKILSEIKSFTPIFSCMQSIAKNYSAGI